MVHGTPIKKTKTSNTDSPKSANTKRAETPKSIATKPQKPETPKSATTADSKELECIEKLNNLELSSTPFVEGEKRWQQKVSNEDRKKNIHKIVDTFYAPPNEAYDDERLKIPTTADLERLFTLSGPPNEIPDEDLMADGAIEVDLIPADRFWYYNANLEPPTSAPTLFAEKSRKQIRRGLNNRKIVLARYAKRAPIEEKTMQCFITPCPPLTQPAIEQRSV
uniref:Uncharacterized protein n=1 Tax=Caenorhabditis tropicalis TaxID=1561998 RepID=A0A1I7V305_9PELO